MKKIKIVYATKTRNYVTSQCYRLESKTVELVPTVFRRRECGKGAASNRYFYSAEFIAPDDAEFSFKGKIIANINRKANPHFNPKNIEWKGNVGRYQDGA